MPAANYRSDWIVGHRDIVVGKIFTLTLITPNLPGSGVDRLDLD